MRISRYGRWLAAVTLAALLPGWGRAQFPDYEVPPEVNPTIPLPIGHDRMENGGFFTALEFLYMHQSRHISDQVIARRGFIDSTGTLTGLAGNFIGSGTPALKADEIGRTTWMPGFDITLGYRFRNGTTLTFDYKHLFEAKYNGGAGPVSQTGISTIPFGANTQPVETFLSAPVYNFSPQFSGPEIKGTFPNPTAANPQAPGNVGIIYGIWNGAAEMSILLTQRYDEANITARIPMFETEYMRFYGLAGGRWAHFWERFKWRTVSYPGPEDPEQQRVFNFIVLPVQDLNINPGAPGTGGNVFVSQTTLTNINPIGQPPLIVGIPNNVIFLGSFDRIVAEAAASPLASDAAIYTNIVSNNLYGPFVGCGTDCYLGKNFAATCDITGAILFDFVTERAKYERGDKATQSKRGRREYTMVPNVAFNASLWWYPIQAVQIKAGYNFMGYFNTVAAYDPVAFDASTVDAAYERVPLRVIHGLDIGIGITF
jgi:hypothetical protein